MTEITIHAGLTACDAHLVAPDDQDYVRVDTAAAAWLPGRISGLKVPPLHDHGTERVALVQWEPESQMPEHGLLGGGEILVLDGSFGDKSERYPAGTWIRYPAGSRISPFSADGCRIYFNSGHLAPMVGKGTDEISMADLAE
ncbi:MAG: cupin domain-containing protein [Rhodospirillales bacterium]|nr:cupin domain-containing protein [Rhodospirillales bacterium]